ncbi:MAG: hypothetical protein JWR44_1376 [Hymenobacter sp.]|jgi:hypothetical protein|nr:hypothetical protein [Hymenobacter sp.]
MDSTELIVAAGQAASTIAKDEELLRQFYKDLGQPGVKQVGKALATVLGLGNTVLIPLKMVNEKANALYTHHMEQFRKKMEQVPEEKTIEAAPEIGVPILENLGKTTNSVISNMYLNLLANASHIDLAKNAHPRFVSVIESLTRDDVTILESQHSYLYLTIEAHITLNYGGENLYGVTVPVNKGTIYHRPGILEFPENAEFYFANLRALGLLEAIDGKKPLVPSGDPFEQLKIAFAEEIKPGEMYSERKMVSEGSYVQTPFCWLFLRACSSITEAASK